MYYRFDYRHFLCLSKSKLVQKLTHSQLFFIFRNENVYLGTPSYIYLHHTLDFGSVVIWVLISCCRIRLTFPPTLKICISFEPQHVECKLGIWENPPASIYLPTLSTFSTVAGAPWCIHFASSIRFDSCSSSCCFCGCQVWLLTRAFGLANYQNPSLRSRHLPVAGKRGRISNSSPRTLWVNKEFPSLNWHVGDLRGSPAGRVISWSLTKEYPLTDMRHQRWYQIHLQSQLS